MCLQVASGDPVVCNRFMKRLTDRYSLYANLGRIDRKGDLVCSAIELSGRLNVADRSYFRRARDSKDFAIGDYQIGKVTAKGSINFGYPILNPSGEVEAVIFAALDLTWLTQLAAEARLPEGASLSILDSQGIILARFPDPEKWFGKPVPDAPLFQFLQVGNQTTRELTGMDSVRRLYALDSQSKSAGRTDTCRRRHPKGHRFRPGRPHSLRKILAGWAWLVCSHSQRRGSSAIATLWITLANMRGRKRRD